MLQTPSTSPRFGLWLLGFAMVHPRGRLFCIIITFEPFVFRIIVRTRRRSSKAKAGTYVPANRCKCLTVRAPFWCAAGASLPRL
ncbi:hypothetical protein DAEQUDRAFT_556501 [Daedalea quercina L-15889]|uniref:Uncharacterized protein n=1 Tax=Daedalea quercina L-15889 TaxID=1314783 RepID=A0A165T5P7_9APHY|nr:hypothetical protein DAEQUDRAFT_556501 [Daedalea quercina L-15889]